MFSNECNHYDVLSCMLLVFCDINEKVDQERTMGNVCFNVISFISIDIRCKRFRGESKKYSRL